MNAFLIFVLIVFTLSAIWIFVEAIYYSVTGKFLSAAIFRMSEIIYIVVLPLMFLMDEMGKKNDCCSDTAYFSPQHRLSITMLILTCIFFYFFASYRNTKSTPVFELFTTLFLIIGLAINVIMIIHSSKINSPYSLLDSQLLVVLQLPIVILELFALVKKHQADREQIVASKGDYTKGFEVLAYRVLDLKFFYKFPLLLFFCVPLLSLISSFLLLFGQRPDSLIKVFTETYYHGLSQLDCTNVNCPGGHFLCTIAASGHPRLVKPLRKGVRNGVIIKVNRQLLIANAFENLLEENIPMFHRAIRTMYDYLGGNFRRLY